MKAAVLIHDEARQITNQISRIYKPAGDTNDVAIVRPDAPSADMAANTMEQKARRTWQQILAFAGNYSAHDLDLESFNKQPVEQVLIPIYEDRRNASGSSNGVLWSQSGLNHQVKEVMVSKNAFRMLRCSVRQLVLPDMMKAIREEIIRNSDLSLKTPHSMTFSVCSGVHQFIHEEIDSGQAFGPILTLSGNATNAYATTCGEYMSWNWPKTGPDTLEAIQLAVQVGFSRMCFGV